MPGLFHICLAERALLAKAAVDHDPPGGRVVRVVPGLDAAEVHILKQEGDQPPESLGHIPPALPGHADAVANARHPDPLANLPWDDGLLAEAGRMLRTAQSDSTRQ